MGKRGRVVSCHVMLWYVNVMGSGDGVAMVLDWIGLDRIGLGRI